MIIKLTKGYETVIDDEDEYIAAYNWCVIDTWNRPYAARMVYNPESKSIRPRTFVFMHKEIMNVGQGQLVDHRDRDSLNNRRSNLRLATHSQNMCNSVMRTGITGYRGVILDKRNGRYRALIRDGSRSATKTFLGTFDNAEEAAMAYDEAAKLYHGEFAVLNF